MWGEEMQEEKLFFKEEIANVTSTLSAKKTEADLMFVVVADSHLDDYEEDTLSNIRAVDSSLHFDFVVHLGDFLNGNLPGKYTESLLNEEMKKYRSATANGIFYPVQGNHDGYCKDTKNKTITDIVLDENWHAATSFVDKYPHLKGDVDNPWYYVDYPDQKVRLIILCSFSYEWDENGEFRKLYKLAPAQIDWLREKALALEEDWTVMLFSHDGPLKYYDQTKYEEELWDCNNQELMNTLLHAKEAKSFSVAAWFIGHWHGDLCQIVEGIPFVIVGSQTCYIPQLWQMPDSGHYEMRERGTVSQDIWDAAILNRAKRELYLCRFGAGVDRVIHY